MQARKNFHQSLRIYWLDQMVVKASFACAKQVFSLPPAGDGYHDGALAPWLLADKAAGFITVEFWYADVKQNDIGAVISGHVHALLSIAGHAGVVHDQDVQRQRQA